MLAFVAGRVNCPNHWSENKSNKCRKEQVTKGNGNYSLSTSVNTSRLLVRVKKKSIGKGSAEYRKAVLETDEARMSHISEMSATLTEG